jgi:hypothetical protein
LSAKNKKKKKERKKKKRDRRGRENAVRFAAQRAVLQ